jgi:hypothetical protein
MALETYVQSLTTQHAAGTAMNTYTTAKSVINAQALYTLPANFWTVGRFMDIQVEAGLSNIATTPGTVTFQVMMGTIVAFTSGAMVLNDTAHTLLPINIDVRLTCRAVGAGTSANLMGQMWIRGIQLTLTADQIDAANTSGVFAGPITAPAVGTGFNSTIANILDFWTGFSVSDAGNGITIHQYAVKTFI